ncbi:MAG: beta-glucosidase [Chitinivibrionales bacterium]|nr:beta-glucosidase [Chitinivibrionales bacterium]
MKTGYKNSKLPVFRRVEDLLGRMTRDEKLAQLHLIMNPLEEYEESKRMIRENGVGSFLLYRPVLHLKELNELQRIAAKESRLGIPVLHGRDVIHGFRTIFPIPLGLAATWDKAAIEKSCAIAAKEAMSAGVHWTFAPMVDIARDPRWGRIAESFGEDPYLCSILAAAAVFGIQGKTAKDLAGPEHILACAKHYIGYGAAEGGRDYNTAEISDNTLRNVYLPPFQAAIKAGAATVMAAFHDLNGEPVSGSRYLCTGLLKEECGFEGFIVSDAGSVYNMINQRVARDKSNAGRIAFNAGVDMEMVEGGSCFRNYLGEWIDKGVVSEERLDDAVGRILAVKFRAGLFENPYIDTGSAKRVFFTGYNRGQAKKIAAQSIVLLKNDRDALPLPVKLQKIAVVGPLADKRRALLGSWVLDQKEEDTQTISEAVARACPGAGVTTVSDLLQDDLFIRIKEADAVIAAVGEYHRRSGEHNNVSSLKLAAGQEELIERAALFGKPLVVVVFAGRPLDLSRISRYADALLYAWHPGSLGAAALADILFGKVNPQARCPVSFPSSTGQVPLHYSHKSWGKRKRPPRYLDSPTSPLYPFGYGLSYTRFSYSAIKATPSKIKPREKVTISAKVTNTGTRAGVETVQCYIQDCLTSLTRPARELKGFQKVRLKPGESKKVAFRLGFDELSFVGLDRVRKVEPGTFKAWIGGDSMAGLECEFEVIA